jgi:hypothetical protein
MRSPVSIRAGFPVANSTHPATCTPPECFSSSFSIAVSSGVDLGKTTFQSVALGEQGNVVVRKKFSRKQLLAYTANLQSSLIGIEACSGAHFIGAVLCSQGHDVRLIPASS